MKTKLLSVLLCLPAVSVIAAEAESASPVETGDWSATIGKIGVLLIQVLGPVLIVLVSYAAAKLAKKLGVEYSSTIDTQIRSLAKMGINYADAWAKNAASKPASKEKMQVAVNFVVDSLSSMGIKNYAASQVEKFVEAQLNWDKKVNPDGIAKINPTPVPPA